MVTTMRNKIKGNIYKHLRKFKENTNKQQNEIRKTIQNLKGEFNKDTEILKKINLKMKSSS
jgi:hypothetical protein